MNTVIVRATDKRGNICEIVFKDKTISEVRKVFNETFPGFAIFSIDSKRV